MYKQDNLIKKGEDMADKEILLLVMALVVILAIKIKERVNGKQSR